MNDKFLYSLSVILGIFSLLLVITNISFVHSNRILQVRANERAAFINKGLGLSQLNEALVQALADASIKNNDTGIRELLSSQGISIQAKDNSASAKDASPSPTKDSKKGKE